MKISMNVVPSGYLTVCHGKSQFLSSVNHLFLWAIFHGYVTNNQRVNQNCQTSPKITIFIGAINCYKHSPKVRAIYGPLGFPHSKIRKFFKIPSMEVPTIYKAYFSGLNFREYPQQIWPEIWYLTSTSNLLDPGDLPLIPNSCLSPNSLEAVMNGVVLGIALLAVVLHRVSTSQAIHDWLFLKKHVGRFSVYQYQHPG